MVNDKKIIVALDFSSYSEVIEFVNLISPKLCRLKIGKELFTKLGPNIVTELQNKGFEIFLDLKFHDIPDTVAKACIAAADLGVWMINIHILGGKRMLEAAQEALASHQTKPYLIGVTLLTSLSQPDLKAIGLKGNPTTIVENLTTLALDTSLDGIVCSAHEVLSLRRIVPSNFVLVTPGIRLEGELTNDQQRVTTPQTAIRDGSNYLVIGRSITQSPLPVQTLKYIKSLISNVYN